MLRTNFLKTALASMLVVCSTAFYSCDSDGEEPSDEGTTSESAIIGKWEVSDGGNTRAAGDTKYGSFEFTADNKYIITQPAVATNGDKYMLVIFGDYVVGNNESNDFTLNLKEFGTIKISINKTSASITIDGVVYVAVKAKEVDLSDNNKKLIGTWKVELSDAEGVYSRGEIIFTSSGTYLGMLTEGDTGELIPNNGTWSLSTGNIITLEYTSYDYDDAPAPEGPNGEKPSPEVEPEVTITQEKDVLTITELTDSKFIFTVTYEEDGYSDTTTMTGIKSK